HRRDRQYLDAGDATGGEVPSRAATQQREAQRDFLAARAQRRAAPQIDDERAWHLAVFLEVRADHLVGRQAAELGGNRRRQYARVSGEEIAAGGQNVAVTAQWRTGGTRRNAPAGERGDHGGAFRGGA